VLVSRDKKVEEDKVIDKGSLAHYGDQPREGASHRTRLRNRNQHAHRILLNDNSAHYVRILTQEAARFARAHHYYHPKCAHATDHSLSKGRQRGARANARKQKDTTCSYTGHRKDTAGRAGDATTSIPTSGTHDPACDSGASRTSECSQNTRAQQEEEWEGTERDAARHLARSKQGTCARQSTSRALPTSHDTKVTALCPRSPRCRG
jgi:hypothetical protein